MADTNFEGGEIEAAIRTLSTNEERAEAYLQAAHAADAAEAHYYRLHFRNQLIETVSFINPVQVLPHIAEFTDIFNQHPDAMGEKGVGLLFENLVYAIEQIAYLPNVPREQWKALVDEVGSCAQRYNRGMQCYWYVAALYYEHIDPEQAMACAREAAAAPHDVNYPYDGYVEGVAARILLAAGNRRQADELAERCISIAGELGRGRCYEGYIWHLLGEGRLEEADANADRLYDIIEESPAVLNDWCFVDLESAVRYLVQLREFLDCRDDYKMEYEFNKAAWATCRQVAKYNDSVFLKLPESFPLYNKKKTYNPSELADYFYSQAHELATVFDARNGTDWFARDLPKACACEGLPSADEAARTAKIKRKGGLFG